jgi:putative component of membrane protein insertase Oxa1/YidC/SpoIIIJ protein YidD
MLRNLLLFANRKLNSEVAHFAAEESLCWSRERLVIVARLVRCNGFGRSGADTEFEEKGGQYIHGNGAEGGSL